MDKDRIYGSAKDIAGKAEGAIGDATGDADTQAAGRIRESAGKMQNLYGQAKEAAKDATGAATAYARQAVDAGNDSTEALAEIVRDNPLRSLWIAAGVGFALALLLRQPYRSRPRRGWRDYD